MTPDDNDLFLSNVAKIPILAIHGYVYGFAHNLYDDAQQLFNGSGNDDNVPTWHSREYYSVVKAWGDGLNISYASRSFYYDLEPKIDTY